jgi:hypothetical protein
MTVNEYLITYLINECFLSKYRKSEAECYPAWFDLAGRCAHPAVQRLLHYAFGHLLAIS